MEWEELSRADAQVCYDRFMETGEADCPPKFMELRRTLLDLFQKSLQEIGITEDGISSGNSRYLLDLSFGLRLYEAFRSQKFSMNLRQASSEGIWRFLSVRVIPDAVSLRWGRGEDHPDRYWKKTNRIWLRTIWWYIHLSWQGTSEETREVLRDNSTDEILQLVDRRGRDGYRVSTCRAMMKKLSTIDPAERRQKQLFRKTLVLNTARIQVMEPELCEGGSDGYVQQLYSYFM